MYDEICEFCDDENVVKYVEGQPVCAACWREFRDDALLDFEEGFSYLDGEDILDLLLTQ